MCECPCILLAALLARPPHVKPCACSNELLVRAPTQTLWIWSIPVDPEGNKCRCVHKCNLDYYTLSFFFASFRMRCVLIDISTNSSSWWPSNKKSLSIWNPVSLPWTHIACKLHMRYLLHVKRYLKLPKKLAIQHTTKVIIVIKFL